MEIRNCINYILHRGQQTVVQVFRKELQPLDITPVQYGILIYLITENGCLSSDIAKEFGLESSTVTGIIDRLEQKGLLKRKAKPNDRRANSIEITPKTLNIFDDMVAASERGNEIIEQKLGKEDFIKLKELLSRIYEE
ncbi:MAG: MarR family transcriptional regulator [Bacillota bacterium]|nr:MarR family transcriptional regulator [Bacillota bacterium]